MARDTKSCGLAQDAMADLNLLEQYAANRAEIAVLRDPQALFALGFLDSAQSATPVQLASDFGLDSIALQALVDKLNHAGLVNTHNQVLTVSAAGKTLLQQLGLSAPPVPPQNSSPESASPIKPTGGAGGLLSVGMLGLLVAGVLVLIVGGYVVSNSIGVIQQRKPTTAVNVQTPTPRPLQKASPTLPPATRPAIVETRTVLPRDPTGVVPNDVNTIELKNLPSALAFNTRGNRLYVGTQPANGLPNPLYSIDATNGKVLQAANLPEAFNLQSLIASPDSRTLFALSYDGDVLALDSQTLQVSKRGQFEPRYGCTSCTALFSPDGNYLLISVQPTIAILDAGTLKQVAALPMDSKVGQLRWSPDGQSLYVPLAQDLIVVYQIELGRQVAAKPIARIPIEGAPVDAIPSLNGQLLYVPRFNKNTIAVINLEKQAIQTELPSDFGLAHMVLVRDGELAAGVSGSIVFLLDTKKGTVTQHDTLLHQNLIALSSDGSVVATADSGRTVLNLVRLH